MRGKHEIIKWTGWIAKSFTIGGHLALAGKTEMVVIVSYEFVVGSKRVKWVCMSLEYYAEMI